MRIRALWPLLLLASACGLDLPESAPSSDGQGKQLASGTLSLSGQYLTNWGPLTLMHVQGHEYAGSYGNPIKGELQGVFDGVRFSFVWTEKEGRGRGYFEPTPDGVVGRWGHDESEHDGGAWTGTRM